MRSNLFIRSLLVLALALISRVSAEPVADPTKTLIPTAAWDCGMPDGIPRPERGALVVEAEVKLDAIYDVGVTPYGHRQVAVTQTGVLTGPKLQGDVLPGGLDFQLTLANGVIELEEVLVLQIGDKGHIIMRNAGTGTDAGDLRVVFDFEAPAPGDLAWLNTGKFVGRRTIDPSAKIMRLSIYEVSAVDMPTDASQTVRLSKPNSVLPQPWDFRHAEAGEQRGDTIITEFVTLGRGPQVRGGKRGNRNVIPITGGTLTGMITGKILFGGADYQTMGGGGPALDARYLWQTAEGDVIIVRNTSNPGIGLVPTFETRVDGKYAWLNSGKYFSSNPGMGAGGVSISMFKSR